MRPIDNWNTVQTQNYGGGFPTLPAGWYSAIILKAQEDKTSGGTPTFDFYVDITGGEYTGYYKKDFATQTPAPGREKKWRGMLRCFTTEKGLPFFKGAITAIEDSNKDYKWDWNEAGLKGKIVGLGVRGEEYEANDGTVKITNRPFAFCDVKKVIEGNMEPPKVKALRVARSSAGTSSGNGSMIPGLNANHYQATAQTAPKFEELDPEEELPF